MLPLYITAAVVLIFFVGYTREKKNQKEYIDSLIRNYGKANNRKFSADEMKAVKTYSSSRKVIIDDITWNDLDMNLIYRNMNYCKSSAGDEYLYYLLRNPATVDKDWSEFENKVNGISNDEVLRRNVVEALCKIGRTGKYSIYAYLESLEQIHLYSSKQDLLLDFLYLPAIALAFINILWGAIAVFFVVAINIGTYFKRKRQIEPYLVCFEYIYRVLRNSEIIIDALKCDLLKDEMTDLVKETEKFKKFMSFSGLVLGDFGSSPIGIVLDYIKMLTHADLIKIRSMYKITMDNRQSIENMLKIVGRIDCYQSVGEYREYIKSYCIPELGASNSGITLENGYHPLIKKPVANSIITDKSILLTGSNASGKSTFLKMVAVNVILAQSIHTCHASEYNAPYYRVYTSLSLKDSIVEGDSYYMAEIKALKRIMDAVDDDIPVIGFVDEILRGTNTVERVAASSAILKNLNDKEVLVFAATHDIELTSILKDYDNYHFEEKIEGDDISFSYGLLKGKAISRNAINLLDFIGYDKDIVEGSKKMVEYYETNGNWSNL